MTASDICLIVWVTQGRTEHHAILLEPLEEGKDTVLIKWCIRGSKERVPASSVRLEDQNGGRRRRKPCPPEKFGKMNIATKIGVGVKKNPPVALNSGDLTIVPNPFSGSKKEGKEQLDDQKTRKRKIDSSALSIGSERTPPEPQLQRPEQPYKTAVGIPRATQSTGKAAVLRGTTCEGYQQVSAFESTHHQEKHQHRKAGKGTQRQQSAAFALIATTYSTPIQIERVSLHPTVETLGITTAVQRKCSERQDMTSFNTIHIPGIRLDTDVPSAKRPKHHHKQEETPSTQISADLHKPDGTSVTKEELRQEVGGAMVSKRSGTRDPSSVQDHLLGLIPVATKSAVFQVPPSPLLLITNQLSAATLTGAATDLCLSFSKETEQGDGNDFKCVVNTGKHIMPAPATKILAANDQDTSPPTPKARNMFHSHLGTYESTSNLRDVSESVEKKRSTYEGQRKSLFPSLVMTEVSQSEGPKQHPSSGEEGLNCTTTILQESKAISNLPSQKDPRLLSAAAGETGIPCQMDERKIARHANVQRNELDGTIDEESLSVPDSHASTNMEGINETGRLLKNEQINPNITTAITIKAGCKSLLVKSSDPTVADDATSWGDVGSKCNAYKRDLPVDLQKEENNTFASVGDSALVPPAIAAKSTDNPSNRCRIERSRRRVPLPPRMKVAPPETRPTAVAEVEKKVLHQEDSRVVQSNLSKTSAVHERQVDKQSTVLGVVTGSAGREGASVFATKEVSFQRVAPTETRKNKSSNEIDTEQLKDWIVKCALCLLEFQDYPDGETCVIENFIVAKASKNHGIPLDTLKRVVLEENRWQAVRRKARLLKKKKDQVDIQANTPNETPCNPTSRVATQNIPASDTRDQDPIGNGNQSHSGGQRRKRQRLLGSILRTITLTSNTKPILPQKTSKGIDSVQGVRNIRQSTLSLKVETHNECRTEKWINQNTSPPSESKTQSSKSIEVLKLTNNDDTVVEINFDSEKRASKSVEQSKADDAMRLPKLMDSQDKIVEIKLDTMKFTKDTRFPKKRFLARMMEQASTNLETCSSDPMNQVPPTDHMDYSDQLRGEIYSRKNQVSCLPKEGSSHHVESTTEASDVCSRKVIPFQPMGKPDASYLVGLRASVLHSGGSDDDPPSLVQELIRVNQDWARVQGVDEKKVNWSSEKLKSPIEDYAVPSVSFD